MPTNRHPFEALRQYLPDGTFELVMPVILQHKVHLTITRERQTKLGDYRHAWRQNNHRISVNGNLNQFAFLLTLLHELAHLLTFEQFGNRVAPHGAEWKRVFGQLLAAYLNKGIFPDDIAAEIAKTLHNPGATTCSEEGLQRVLVRYDQPSIGLKLVEEIPEGSRFVIKGGRIFIRGNKLRKRIKCFELPHMREYLFNPVYQVKEIA